ncbi:hypothetical protein OROMI_003211 [Orobanche minor]
MLRWVVIFTYSCFSQLARSLSLSAKSFRSEASISSSELHNSDESATISSRKIGSGRKMAPTKIYVIQGGEWSDDNKYEGGRRELIHIPPGDISLKDLVAKIEMRLMKPRDGYVYEIDALINDDESIEGDSTDELVRTKITDDFELSFVMRSTAKPVLYITTTPINAELSRLLLHHNLFLASNPVVNKTMRSLDKDSVVDNSRLDKYPMASKMIPSFVNDHFNDDDDPNFHLDDFHHEDFQDEYLDDDDVGTQEEDRCGSNRLNVSLLQTTQDSVQGSSNVGRQWTIQGASFHRLAPSENLETAIVEVAGCRVDKIAKDVIFNNKASMIASVGLYHLLQHLEFETKKSSPQRYVLVCKHNKDVCHFILRAKSLGKAWVVDVWCTHTCEKDLRYHADPTFLSKVLASYFVPNLMVEGVVLRPRDIQAQVQRLFGAKIKYSTALSARNQALTMTYGDSSESFRKLPSYFYMLEQSNPCSVVDLQTDEAGAFEYCFMSLAASIRGFKACRPVIVVDGTHLKGKYNGIMFVAATKDANEQIFPLAFGFGAKECDESWIWFLEQCRRTFGSPENLLIVSDQHVSSKNALDVVYPGIPHGICTYHLHGKIRWWGDHAIIMFQAAANAYRCRDFEDRMANLKGFAPGAHDKLMAADPVRCNIPHFWIPWFAERRAEAMKRTQELTAFAEARLARAAELSHKYSIEEISPTKYKANKTVTVAYVAGYFSTQALREIYAGEVMPTPIPGEGCVPVEVSSRIVVTPANTRQAGRPRQNRMSAGSGSRTSGSKFCGRCFQRGHYQNTCKVYMDIEISVEEASTSQVVNTSKRRRPKTCSICHVTGHTRQTCTVQRLFGAKIKYSTALSARNQALTMTYGDSSESFRKLPSYFYMLEQSNPGSVVDLQTDEAGAFEYCFMSLAASIRGFKACRPVIVVDGTHLKGKYNGIMFVATTKDANEQIFPLAFGFGAKECDESWIWFLEQCRRTFGSPENLLIVSDQHVSIKNALDVVYPGTPHGICTYHLHGKIRWWGDHAIIMFQAAANAYRCRDFEDRMDNLKGFAPGAHDKLMDADPVIWARSMCPVRRYNFLTSNCAECLNGRLRWARKLPVCTLLECVRLMIGQWFAERRAEAMKRTQELTAFAEARLARAAELSHKYSIEEISPTKYKPYVPQTKQSAVAYVTRYFSTQALREIYAGEVMPTPIPEEWCVPVEVSSRIVVTPANTRQAGRPRQNRMSAGSGSRTSGSKFCGRCFQSGHYQNTCKVYMDIEISVEEASTSQVVNTSKRSRPKTCSICHVTGHTRQTCSKRPIQP